MQRIMMILFTWTCLAGPSAGANTAAPRVLDRAAESPIQPTADREANAALPPTTAPNQLPPLDPSVLPPPESRWDSPEAQARHRRIMDELWATKLGQLYLAFLTEPLPSVTIPGRANQIITQIFADGDKSGKRLRVVQLLTEDLYARERMSEDITRRTIIFDRVVHSRQSAGEEATNRWIVNGMITTFAVSLPFGFQRMRDHASRYYEMIAARAPFRGRYQFPKAFNIFLTWFGPISMFYFVWYQWKAGWVTENSRDGEMLNGRDELLENAEF